MCNILGHSINTNKFTINELKKRNERKDQRRIQQNDIANAVSLDQYWFMMKFINLKISSVQTELHRFHETTSFQQKRAYFWIKTIETKSKEKTKYWNCD